MNIPPLPENCKPIPEFLGYCAHPDGYILSCHNGKWGYRDTWHRLHSGANSKYGRQVVVLGRNHPFHVHRLMLLAFVGDCPVGMEACHNNGNASDNRIDNLRWDTKANNALDLRTHGKKKGVNHPLAKLNDDIVREIRRRIAGGETQQSVADALGIQRRNVGRVADRTRWGHVV